MTMTQQDKDVLSQNWDQAKAQVQSQFPVVTEDELNSTPDQISDIIVGKTGQDRSQVEKALKQIAQQYTSS
jgi:uncharacterized protein YjbJ (UPF0337 family)